jgi:N-methylhydantoinase A/oxoprolinase/acetone carboxylase beta subunit
MSTHAMTSPPIIKILVIQMDGGLVVAAAAQLWKIFLLSAGPAMSHVAYSSLSSTDI